jgi:hypothetical protein
MEAVMKNIAAIAALVLALLVTPLFAADDVAALKAEIEMLRKTVQQQAERIRELKAEVEKLKAQVADWKKPEAEEEKMPAAKHDDPMPPEKVKTYRMTDVPADLKIAQKEMVGHRYFCAAEVHSIVPDEEEAGKYVVTLIEDTQWIGKRWVQFTIVLRAPEETALTLDKGRKLNVVGDIDKIDVLGGYDFMGAPRKGKDEVLRIYLKNAKAR